MVRICLLAAEATPLASTGGLGDVTAALAVGLSARDHDVRLFLPYYDVLELKDPRHGPVDFLQNLKLDIGGRDPKAIEVDAKNSAVYAAAGKALSSLGGLRQKIALFLVGLLGYLGLFARNGFYFRVILNNVKLLAHASLQVLGYRAGHLAR